jgi:hypothetical protein
MREVHGMSLFPLQLKIFPNLRLDFRTEAFYPKINPTAFENRFCKGQANLPEVVSDRIGAELQGLLPVLLLAEKRIFHMKIIFLEMNNIASGFLLLVFGKNGKSPSESAPSIRGVKKTSARCADRSHQPRGLRRRGSGGLHRLKKTLRLWGYKVKENACRTRKLSFITLP